MSGEKSSSGDEVGLIFVVCIAWVMCVLATKGFQPDVSGDLFIWIPVGGAIFTPLFLRQALVSKIVGIVVAGLHIIWLVSEINWLR